MLCERSTFRTRKTVENFSGRFSPFSIVHSIRCIICFYIVRLQLLWVKMLRNLQREWENKVRLPNSKKTKKNYLRLFIVLSSWERLICLQLLATIHLFPLGNWTVFRAEYASMILDQDHMPGVWFRTWAKGDMKWKKTTKWNCEQLTHMKYSQKRK